MWVIVALASLAALLIIVLCVPLDVVLHTDVYGGAKFRLRLSWLFGLVSKDIAKEKKKPEEKRRVVEGKRKPGERRKGIRAIFQILQAKGLLRQVQGLLKDVLSRFKVGNLVADFRVGLGDPADTGLLFAIIGTATPFLGSSRFHEIRVVPSFEDKAIFEGYSHGRVRLRPIQLVAPLLRFIFSLATIRAVKILVLSKWTRKK
ncbi:DUF2953 domain-containing protein [Chloroflexota bacterium]